MGKPSHVMPRLGRGAVVEEGAEQPRAEFDEHEQAEAWARRNAGDAPEIVVHSRRGEVRTVLMPQPPEMQDDLARREPPWPDPGR